MSRQRITTTGKQYKVLHRYHMGTPVILKAELTTRLNLWELKRLWLEGGRLERKLLGRVMPLERMELKPMDLAERVMSLGV